LYGDQTQRKSIKFRKRKKRTPWWKIQEKSKPVQIASPVRLSNIEQASIPIHTDRTVQLGQTVWMGIEACSIFDKRTGDAI
jgi:hypothetical protein